MTEAKRGWRWELLGGALPAAIGLTANLLGAAHIPRGWLAAGLLALATAGAFVGRAASRWSSPSKSRSDLIAALAAILTLVAGGAVYHQWFDGRGVQYVLDGPADACASPFQRPGDKSTLLRNHQLCGGASTAMVCWVKDGEETLWLKAASGGFYYGRGLHRADDGGPSLPEC